MSSFSRPFGGMRIIETPTALLKVRVRTYPRSHRKSERHWQRMDKKYLKRYGWTDKPAAIRFGDTYFVHPALIPTLRQATKEFMS